MGIDTGSMLIVGLQASEFPEALQQMVDEGDGYYETIGEDSPMGLNKAAPYYDAPPDACVWGIKICGDTWTPAELPPDFADRIAAAKVAFKEKTGADAKVYVSANVW